MLLKSKIHKSAYDGITLWEEENREKRSFLRRLMEIAATATLAACGGSPSTTVNKNPSPTYTLQEDATPSKQIHRNNILWRWHRDVHCRGKLTYIARLTAAQARTFIATTAAPRTKLTQSFAANVALHWLRQIDSAIPTKMVNLK